MKILKGLLLALIQILAIGTASAETAPRGDTSVIFASKILGSTESAWTELFREHAGAGDYRAPKLVFFTGTTTSSCGAILADMGPVYCPDDQEVYLDPGFFDEMRSNLKICPSGEGICIFAQAYLLAHEVGRHVQEQLGILPKVLAMEQKSSDAQRADIALRTELQADCFAGVWANRVERKGKFLQSGDVPAGIQVAAEIRGSLKSKTPAELRVRWFMMGLKSGSVSSCDTFGANPL